jgi:hypothetical protein
LHRRAGRDLKLLMAGGRPAPLRRSRIDGLRALGRL